MRLRVVGCSGSFAGPTSPASSYLVQARDKQGRLWTVVLDMGSGAFGALQALMDPEAVDAVGLTHLHPDHCADMTGMNVYGKYRPGAALPDVKVWGPTGTAEHLNLLQYSHDPYDPDSKLDVTTWEEGKEVRVGPIRIIPYPVVHPVEAWGMRIYGPSHVRDREAVLGFSGDTDLCEGLDTLAKDSDLLLIEAAFDQSRDASRGVHLTGERAGEAAAKAKAKRVVITHLPPWNDPEAAVQAVRTRYDGPVHVARSRDSYVI
jgi:ribonuclease BN (tRNA processing enzyme)